MSANVAESRSFGIRPERRAHDRSPEFLRIRQPSTLSFFADFPSRTWRLVPQPTSSSTQSRTLSKTPCESRPSLDRVSDKVLDEIWYIDEELSMCRRKRLSPYCPWAL